VRHHPARHDTDGPPLHAVSLHPACPLNVPFLCRFQRNRIAPAAFLQQGRGIPPRPQDEERGEKAMNWDQVAGNWKQMTGKVKEQWGKLTDDDLAAINGKRDQLVGRVQERYGVAKEEAERRVRDWETGFRA
jgi:uncharacterized protein YjbJ (UPF0337 family)